MGAIKNLVNSEKGLIGALLIVGVTVLAIADKVSFDAWQDYTKWIFGIYVAGKTVQGSFAMMADAKKNAPPEPTSTVGTANVIVQPASSESP